MRNTYISIEYQVQDICATRNIAPYLKFNMFPIAMLNLKDIFHVQPLQ